MTDNRTYPHGVPCWIDTEQPDPAAAQQFYGALFGWTFAEAMPAGAPGSYVIAQLDGHDVAAVAPTDAPKAVWSTYVAVDDADEIGVRVTQAGGGVTRPAADAGLAGRSAAFVDPEGAAFGVWRPRRRLGAQLVNVPGAWNFSDLHTSDLAAAKVFYGRVFGWEADVLDQGNGQTATLWRRPGYGDHLAATVDPDIHRRQGAIHAPPGFADAIAWLVARKGAEAPHWHVTFAVGDRDDMVTRAMRLGGSDVSGPIDTPWTKATTILDPQGATFTMSQFTPPT